MLVQAQLKSTVDADHRSDWCTAQGEAEAKRLARENYVAKYPHDDLANTTYVTKPAVGSKSAEDGESLDEMVVSFRSTVKEHSLNNIGARLMLKEDSGDDLFSLVQESKKAPGSTSIAAVDTTGPGTSGGNPNAEALAIYNDMLVLSSLANVVSMKSLYDDHPEKYDITIPQQATAFVRAQAVNLNDTFTRRLGAYAIPGETTSQHYSKEVTSVDLHLDFLTEIFGSFNFPKAAFDKLDGILTQVKNSLANLKVSFESEDETLDHMIFTNYIEPIEVPGIKDPVLTGKIRMFYLKINQHSWKASVGKSSVAKISFTMDFFDTIFTINSQLVRTDTSTIAELIKNFTNHSFEDMKKLTSPAVVKK